MKKFIFFWLFFIITTIILIAYLYITNIDYVNETFRKFEINFSHDSGFYEKEFSLTLTTPRKDAKIYYTLDGSNPNPDNVGGNNEYYYYQEEFQKEPKKIYYETFLYEKPLMINQKLVENNNLHKKRTANSSVPEINNLFKGVIIKAIAIDEDDNKTEITINNYFVDENIKNKFQLPIISIITEPHNLMDYYGGIYVPGKVFDDNYDEDIDEWNLAANYNQRGRDWEKASYLLFFEDVLNLAYENNIKVKFIKLISSKKIINSN